MQLKINEKFLGIINDREVLIATIDNTGNVLETRVEKVDIMKLPLNVPYIGGNNNVG